MIKACMKAMRIIGLFLALCLLLGLFAGCTPKNDDPQDEPSSSEQDNSSSDQDSSDSNQGGTIDEDNFADEFED